MPPNFLTTLLVGWLLLSPEHRTDAGPMPMSSSESSAQGKQLGQECTITQQCELDNRHSHCLNDICTCKEGFFHVQDINGTVCLKGSFVDVETATETLGEPTTDVQMKMIPIIVALGVMFVGICVAMHLFSKARFRDHRTIFNSPHPRLMHIKVSRSQKSGKRRTSFQVPDCRQTSLSAQVSPHTSRFESQQGSQEPLNPPSKSTGSSLVESPTSQPGSSFSSNTVKKVSADVEIKKAKVDLEPLRLSYTAVPTGPSSPTVIISNRRGSTVLDNDSSDLNHV
ncbi:uncharacterized protein LOC143239239 isoform X2 [Tachypleus tridentatus]|uniref:uncharacterized protein LOC143239239 isoform X2 n=1 Tax=Tachypleus tridentatus TaxID=6853 RepID=UPI003FD5E1AE